LRKEIILGTAQLDDGYGQTRRGELLLDEVKKIFDYSYSHGINHLDTAPVYGNSEYIIGQLNAMHKITTKIPSYLDETCSYEDWITGSISGSLIKLKKNSVENLLFHDARNFIENFSPKISELLNHYKINGTVKKIGFSIYNPNEFDEIFKLYKPDLIQFPLNPFDQRFLSQNFIELRTKSGIETYARSIFLQGTLLSRNFKNINYFARWGKTFELWDQFCINNNLKTIEACLIFVQSIKHLTGFTFGVNSIEELKEIVSAISIKKNISFSTLSMNDLNLLDPRRWPKS
jgi:aryl-alcohol dehydrogenase-like predicted oxidoreductase